MNNVTKEQRYLKLIAEIKWRQGFRCRKCRHKKYYTISKKYSRRCKKCEYEESAVFKTAFEGSKISVVTKLKILFAVKDYHLQYENENESRISLDELSRKFKVNKNTITLFFKSIYDFIDKEKADVPDSFVKDLQNKSKLVYEEIYWLLFLRIGIPHSEIEVISKLTKDDFDYYSYDIE